MKQFNIAQYHYIINGLHLPIGAVYGTFTSTYKKFIGTEQVFTKRRNVVDKPRFETINEEITYYCDDFKNYSNNGTAYNVHVWNPHTEKWFTVATSSHEKYKPLGEFLHKLFQKNNITPQTKTKKWYDGLKESVPHEKKAQAWCESVYRPTGAYALSGNVMTCHNINGDGWASYDKVPKTMSL